MNTLKKVLLFLWQLPQNLVGIILTFSCKKTYRTKFNDGTEGTIFFTNTVFGAGVSLGNFIILDYKKYWNFKENNSLKTIYNHEHGHQKQSMYLGPVYLIFIGVPSSIGNILDRFLHLKHLGKCWYYKQPWEKWADSLGGVKRF